MSLRGNEKPKEFKFEGEVYQDTSRIPLDGTPVTVLAFHEGEYKSFPSDYYLKNNAPCGPGWHTNELKLKYGSVVGWRE